MEMHSKVKLNLPYLKKLTAASKTALEQTAEWLHTEVVQSQKMPFKTGNLQNESTFVDRTEVQDGHVSLVSSTPYARRLYFHPEYNFSTKENADAQGEWLKDWVSGGANEKDIVSAYIKIYKRLIGL